MILRYWSIYSHVDVKHLELALCMKSAIYNPLQLSRWCPDEVDTCIKACAKESMH